MGKEHIRKNPWKWQIYINSHRLFSYFQVVFISYRIAPTDRFIFGIQAWANLVLENKMVQRAVLYNKFKLG